jgi:hypothetical protein
LPIPCKLLKGMAGTTGLEPAASAVTGQRSNQLNYVPTLKIQDFAKSRAISGVCEKRIQCRHGRKVGIWQPILAEPPPNRLQISAFATTKYMLTQRNHRSAALRALHINSFEVGQLPLLLSERLIARRGLSWTAALSMLCVDSCTLDHLMGHGRVCVS